jgi:hypothetical protein
MPAILTLRKLIMSKAETIGVESPSVTTRDKKESIVRSIRFPKSLLSQLQQEAERTDRTLNNLVLKACKEALARARPLKTRK